MKQRGFALAEVLALLLVVALFGGWVANIVKFIGMLGGDVSTMFIARAVGIFAAPLGAVLGFL